MRRHTVIVPAARLHPLALASLANSERLAAALVQATLGVLAEADPVPHA